METSHTPAAGKTALRHFLESEAAGGILLLVASAIALILANSPLAHLYFGLLHLEVGPELTKKLGPMSLHLWINDGVMAVFFLLVGLEIKREFLDGRLAGWEQRRLPVIAAGAGMAVPALIYLATVGGSGDLADGWAIPAATDIAFAVGVLALLGNRVPTSLKLFVLTVAIVDDLGAVAIIAFAYTPSINSLALGIAAGIVVLLYAAGKNGVHRLSIYLLGGALSWYFVLISGVHATVAGVLTAAAVPLVKAPGARDAPGSPLQRLEHKLSPLASFVIIPLFGFANAGVSLAGVGMENLVSPLPLGIAAGLFFGKQLGIFIAIWLAVKLGLGKLPKGANWRQIYGVSILCGIGFTMSLFIGSLAFPNYPLLVEEAKIGILLGSLLSASVGFLVLRFSPTDRIRFRHAVAENSEI